MPEFGAEDPIEDVVEQRIPVGDDQPDLSGHPGAPMPVEAPEADFAEQQIEVPDEDFDR